MFLFFLGLQVSKVLLHDLDVLFLLQHFLGLEGERGLVLFSFDRLNVELFLQRRVLLLLLLTESLVLLLKPFYLGL